MEFTLTNEQRKYFGLDPVPSHWDCTALRNNVWIYFDHDHVKKVIQCRASDCYIERDYDLKTNQRRTLLPKTSKGKEKPLTLSSIETHSPIHFSFVVRFDKRDRFNSEAYAASISNQHCLSERMAVTECNTNMKTFAQLQEWIMDFIQSSPAGYTEVMSQLKKQTLKKINYQSGDLFAFPLSRTSFGIGKILFPIKHITSKKLVSPPHYFLEIMQVPVLVRLYGTELFCKNALQIPVVDTSLLQNTPMLPAYFMSDRYLFRGHYPLIGNIPLTKDELDFPVSYDLQNNVLCWGLGMTHIKRPLKVAIDPSTQGVLLRNNGVKGGASVSLLRNYLQGNEVYHEYEIHHSKNKKLYTEIIRAAGLLPSITYDEFCKETHTFNREELIDLLNVK